MEQNLHSMQPAIYFFHRSKWIIPHLAIKSFAQLPLSATYIIYMYVCVCSTSKNNTVDMNLMND